MSSSIGLTTSVLLNDSSGPLLSYCIEYVGQYEISANSLNTRQYVHNLLQTDQGPICPLLSKKSVKTLNPWRTPNLQIFNGGLFSSHFFTHLGSTP